MTTYSIPVANLSDSKSQDQARREQFIQTVGSSLRDIGFFALTNHGIGEKDIANTYELIHDFFQTPEEEKKKYSGTAGGQRGYTPFGVEHAKDQDAPDLKEFWHVGREFDDTSSLKDLYPPNVWPEGKTQFKSVLLDMFHQLESCASDVLKACALFIGEEEDRFASMSVDGDSIYRLIHYPPVPEDRNPSSIRAAAHEDINLITLLIDATDSGLELLKRNQEWMPVVTPPGCIIVDSGDMLQNISNGYFKSTTHRVTNPGNSRDRRYSMPFFVHPRHECSLNPLASCVALTEGNDSFPNITAGEFLTQRLREIGLIKN